MKKSKINIMALALAMAMAGCSGNHETEASQNQPSSKEATAEALPDQGTPENWAFANRLWRTADQEIQGEVDFDEKQTPNNRLYTYVHKQEYSCKAQAEKNDAGKFIIKHSECSAYDSEKLYQGLMRLTRVNGDSAQYQAGDALKINYILSNDPQDPSIEDIIQYAKEHHQFHVEQ